MPGSTPTLDFPYPLGSDPIRDGDDVIQALAEQVETEILARTENRADHPTLAAAIAAAGSGGTVTYPDDTTWNEPATTITAPVTFAGRATVRKSGNGALFTITSVVGVKFARELTLDGRGTVYTGPIIAITGNGSSSDLIVECDLVDSEGPCVEVGIGAAIRGRLHSKTAWTRQRTVTDGASTAASTTITSATAAFTAADVGKIIYLLDAQDSTAGNYHWAKILSVTNATTIVVDVAPTNTVSGKTMTIGAPAYRFDATEQSSGVSGDRSILGTQCFGGPLVDVSGAQNLNISDTFSRGIYFSTGSCAKVNISGANRVATTGAELRIRGTQHVIAGANIGGSLRFMSNANSCVEAGNVIAGVVSDEGNQNKVATPVNPPMGPHTLDPRLLNSGTTLNANQVVYLRSRGRGWVSKIGVHVNVASGNICAGVYSSVASNAAGSTARPNARKATTGSMVCPAAGYQELTLSGGSVWVDEGDWLALVADNATASFFRAGAAGFSTQLANGFSHHQSGAFPLPATAAPSVGADFSLILVGVV